LNKFPKIEGWTLIARQKHGSSSYLREGTRHEVEELMKMAAIVEISLLEEVAKICPGNPNDAEIENKSMHYRVIIQWCEI